jgi:hypothetical protein
MLTTFSKLVFVEIMAKGLNMFQKNNNHPMIWCGMKKVIIKFFTKALSIKMLLKMILFNLRINYFLAIQRALKMRIPYLTNPSSALAFKLQTSTLLT